MNLETQIELIDKAIDALIDVEPVVGSPAIAETLARLNSRRALRQDELENAVTIDPAEYRGADYGED